MNKNDYCPPYRAAGLAALSVWLLYALTLSPTTAFWDTSEYIATAHILGVPHAPGNPLFVLLANVWDKLLAPFGISTAVRINLFSATMSALAHGCWFLAVHRILAFFSNEKSFRIVGAAAATLISATAFTVWNQSNVNEKVYTVALFTIALLSWLILRWRDGSGVNNDKQLVLIAFILFLSVGNHLMGFLAAPALLLFVLVVKPRTFANWKLYPPVLGAAVVGLSVQLYLPLRAAQQPIINEADPSCASFGSALISVFTNGQAGCPALSDALTRRQFGKPSVLTDPIEAARGNVGAPRSAALIAAQMGNYLQYFDWQWARSISGHRNFFGGWRPLITLLFAALGIYGAWCHFKRDRKSFWYFAVLFGTLSFALTFYLNFRYGYTYPVDAGADAREVRERDYFFLVSFSLWGLWAGIGLAAASQWLRERIDDAFAHNLRARWAAVAVFAVAFIPLAMNWSWASRKHDWTARDWAVNLLNSVEPYGLLFTNGDNDTFPLWYAQEVEGIRQDVTVVVMSYLNTPWYARQIRGLTTPCQTGQDPHADRTRIICQRPYDDARGPRVFAETQRPPTRSVLRLDDAQITQITDTAPFMSGENLVYKAGRIETVIPQNEVMLPADMLLAYIIRDTIDDRPVFFATTTAAYQELNLNRHIVRVGVAYKLVNGPVAADPRRGIYEMPAELASATGPFVDLPRTAALVNDVFVHHAGFPDDFRNWPDAATQQLPMYYALTHQALALAYVQAGDTTAADREVAQVHRFLRLGNQRVAD